ncbi:ethanolamine ammonia-lyase subunit EutC [Domibacillus enclensis]|uniref:Ethanolamine ammonia-lyase small subunit n=1 Tax=Domibacillus enclensis TaxID=1017273 RepID=A0A1N6ZEN7_9BACI|nr:ethanolamine ammonia-lyase subunit EutC [Domibacillus enclensis]OXS76683.1 ethanolamine ammonia-lyase [Domibacillus enclensis]SIR25289.1 Ethanolamine ammonia-lyase light chain [Domibacillus enclensis]
MNEVVDRLKNYTPARIGVGRTGTRPLTKEFLSFRIDHAAAVDSVYGEVAPELLESFQLFSVDTCIETKEHYLTRPDQGRLLSEAGEKMIWEKCVKQPQVQVVVSDGLSANAIEENMADVYPALMDSLEANGLSAGTPFFVKGGRVGCMDAIGELLKPDVFVLLIGERPGLVCAHSMSAYMCYRPRAGTRESERMVISNIHRRGTPPVEAAAHIGTILSKMIEQKTSGVGLVM